VGGPLSLVKNGDTIRIDAARGTLELAVPAAELRRRKARAPKRDVRGVLEKYAAQVGPANLGAVTHGQRRRSQ
jgi:dihydroxy-acid dehydratase